MSTTATSQYQSQGLGPQSGAGQTDHSGTIAVANTAQALMPVNKSRVGYMLTASADVWINELGAATEAYGAGSYKIAAGTIYTSEINRCPVNAISIIAATTATFTCREW